ncbi:hypothetical protein [Colwellia sp. MEBiC06753]
MEATEKAPEVSGNTHPNKRSRKWLLIPAVIVISVCLYFIQDMSVRNSYVNNENYRILFETSVAINNNFHKLKQALDTGESSMAIRALFPSYAMTKEREKGTSFKGANFTLKSKKLIVEIDNEALATLSDSDILPSAGNGFSKVLVVDSQGNVVTTLGNDTKLSFTNLNAIANAFAKNQRGFFSSFTSTKKEQPEQEFLQLPTNSSHVDVKLAHGKYRVYVYPFTLESEIKYVDNSGESQDAVANLLLVGFVEEVELTKRAISKWNVPIVVISIMSLLVLIAVLRLTLQPKNQFTTYLYRVFVVTSCYLAFAASLALVLATVDTKRIADAKKNTAEHYTKKLAADFNNEIFNKFTLLAKYRRFFQQLVELYPKEGNKELATLTNKTVNYCRQGTSGQSNHLFLRLCSH